MEDRNKKPSSLFLSGKRTHQNKLNNKRYSIDQKSGASPTVSRETLRNFEHPILDQCFGKSGLLSFGQLEAKILREEAEINILRYRVAKRLDLDGNKAEHPIDLMETMDALLAAEQTIIDSCHMAKGRILSRINNAHKQLEQLTQKKYTTLLRRHKLYDEICIQFEAEMNMLKGISPLSFINEPVAWQQACEKKWGKAHQLNSEAARLRLAADIIKSRTQINQR